MRTVLEARKFKIKVLDLVSSEGPLPGSQTGHLLTIPSHVLKWQEWRELSGVFLLRALILFLRIPLYDLINSAKLYFLVLSHWALTFSVRIWEATQILNPQHFLTSRSTTKLFVFCVPATLSLIVFHQRVKHILTSRFLHGNSSVWYAFLPISLTFIQTSVQVLPPQGDLSCHSPSFCLILSQYLPLPFYSTFVYCLSSLPYQVHGSIQLLLLNVVSPVRVQ